MWGCVVGRASGGGRSSDGGGERSEEAEEQASGLAREARRWTEEVREREGTKGEVGRWASREGGRAEQARR